MHILVIVCKHKSKQTPVERLKLKIWPNVKPMVYLLKVMSLRETIPNRPNVSDKCITTTEKKTFENFSDKLLNPWEA